MVGCGADVDAGGVGSVVAGVDVAAVGAVVAGGIVGGRGVRGWDGEFIFAVGGGRGSAGLLLFLFIFRNGGWMVGEEVGMRISRAGDVEVGLDWGSSESD